MSFQIKEHEIKLSGIMNMRDLGGYPTTDGGYTKNGVYFRGDSLHNLNEEDVITLQNLGVTLQVDLRSTQEISARQSRLLGIQGIDYCSISLLDHIHSSNFENMPKSMADLYCELLDYNHKKFAAIFRTLISAEGASIINCTAGKDRTGVIAMLLLSLAQVDETIIIEDYSVSAANLSELVLTQKAQTLSMGLELPDFIFLSDPEDMKITLKHLKDKYENAEKFFLRCGILSEEIEEFRKRFLIQ